MKLYRKIGHNEIPVEVLMSYRDCHACGERVYDMTCSNCGLHGAPYNGYVVEELGLKEEKDSYVLDLKTLGDKYYLSHIRFDEKAVWDHKNGKVIFPKSSYRAK